MAGNACVNCRAPIRALPTARYCSAEACRKVRQAEINRRRGKPGAPRPCAECGRTIPDDRRPPTLTCSAECATERTRATSRRYYQKLATANPEFNRARHRNTLAQLAAEPGRVEAFRAAQHERAVARWAAMTDAERQTTRLKNREWYTAHATRIQQDRRDRLESMPAEQFATYVEASREYQRQYAARKRADRRLRETIGIAAELTQRIEETP